MKTSIARISLVAAALFAPFAAFSADLPERSVVPIPTHELNLSPSFSGYSTDRSLLTTSASGQRQARPAAPAQVATGVTSQQVFTYAMENANVKQVEAILKNLFPSSTARTWTVQQADPLVVRPTNSSATEVTSAPVYIYPAENAARGSRQNPSDAELAEARQNVREALMRVQEALTRLQQLNAERKAARAKQTEPESAEKPSTQPDPKP